MGYHTKFALETCDPETNELKQLNKEYIDNQSENFKHVCYFCGEKAPEIKWYDHERELLEISKDNPNLLFALYGWGEEEEDIWVKYFLGGKIQREEAEIVYPKFHMGKLKERKE